MPNPNENCGCDYSYTCSFHQAQIDAENEKLDQKERMEKLEHTMAEILGKLNAILQRLGDRS